ncbi:MAG: hypothetical protein WDN69_14140 [Aliidongia sp.]
MPRPRAEAAARLAEALDELVLLGVKVNSDYLARVLRHPGLPAGRCIPDSGRTCGGISRATVAGRNRSRTACRNGARGSGFPPQRLCCAEPYASVGAWRN